MRFDIDPRTVALGLLLVCLAGSAVAFGAVESWSDAWLRVGAFAALTALAWSGSVRTLLPRASVALVVPGLAMVVWSFVQAVPVTSTVVSWVSPKASALYQRTIPPGGGASLPQWLVSRAESDAVRLEPGTRVAEAPADDGDFSVGRTLSIYPHATRASALTGLTLLVLFVVAAGLARDDLYRYRLLVGIGGCVGLLSLVTVLHRLSGDTRILWLRDRSPESAPLGPFINPDHAAGYVALGLLTLVGLILARLAAGQGDLTLTGVRDALFDRGYALPRLLVLGGAAVMCLVVLAVARSRGAWLGLAAGSLFVAGWRWLPRRIIGAAFAVVIVAGCVVGFTSWVFGSGEHLQTTPFATVERDASLALRVDAWARTFEILLDYPITGTGLGTFRWVFGSYLRAGEWEIWSHAHNDYVQWLAETGLVGLAILAWAAVVFVRAVLLPAVDASEDGVRWTTAAVASAVFAMAVHSIVDFNLHIPATAALCAVLLGVLSAAADDVARGAHRGGGS